jgi:hypothetical protein
MTELLFRFNGYLVRHRLLIGLSLLGAALAGTAVASQGLSLRDVLHALPF